MCLLVSVHLIDFNYQVKN